MMHVNQGFGSKLPLTNDIDNNFEIGKGSWPDGNKGITNSTNSYVSFLPLNIINQT